MKPTQKEAHPTIDGKAGKQAWAGVRTSTAPEGQVARRAGADWEQECGAGGGGGGGAPALFVTLPKSQREGGSDRLSWGPVSTLWLAQGGGPRVTI